jgi:hypothetical protein
MFIKNINNSKHWLILIFLLFSGCGPYWYKPHGSLFRQMPKGSPGFELGWKHGCSSGLGSQFTGAIFMTFYTWSRDPDIIKYKKTPQDIARIRARYPKELKNINWSDPKDINKNFAHYNKMFWKAHAFCRHSALGQMQNAGMSIPIPGQSRIDFEQHDIGKIYKIDGRGDARWGNGLW